MYECLTPQADGLLPAAMRPSLSRGRRHFEVDHSFRNPYQRDRDRIIHSSAFRRLEYKTQVFVNGEGDNYRTRLTHTLEVTQIARTMVRTLHLNEDLAEAVALSHDVGHTPFGHAGERKLAELLRDHGGFDHNSHGLRVVDTLENRYAAFRGLNLCYETREAFISHGGENIRGETDEFPRQQPLLEVEATIIADDIAYLAHDVDDGLYSGLLTVEDLEGEELWRQATDMPVFRELSPSLKRAEGVRRLINIMVLDVLETAKKNIMTENLDSVEKVRRRANAVVDFSNTMKTRKSSLKKFLFHNFYRHPNVMEVMEQAQNILEKIYGVYVREPDRMPSEYRQMASSEGVARAAADYVAGMTDRFARDEYTRFFSVG